MIEELGYEVSVLEPFLLKFIINKEEIYFGLNVYDLIIIGRKELIDESIDNLNKELYLTINAYVK